MGGTGSHGERRSRRGLVVPAENPTPLERFQNYWIARKERHRVIPSPFGFAQGKLREESAVPA